MSRAFNNSTSSTVYQIPSDLVEKLWDNWRRSFWFFCSLVTMNECWGHLFQYQNIEFDSIYHHAKFEAIQFINITMRANVKLFSTVSNTAVISLVSLNLSERVASRCCFNCFNAISNFILIRWKVCRKWSQQLLLCAGYGQGHWKWYKMLEVNRAGMNKSSRKVYMKCPTLKFMPHKMTDYIVLHVTNMDQKVCMLLIWIKKGKTKSTGLVLNNFYTDGFLDKTYTSCRISHRELK